jgi:hypothetical protein
MSPYTFEEGKKITLHTKNQRYIGIFMSLYIWNIDIYRYTVYIEIQKCGKLYFLTARVKIKNPWTIYEDAGSHISKPLMGDYISKLPAYQVCLENPHESVKYVQYKGQWDIKSIMPPLSSDSPPPPIMFNITEVDAGGVGGTRELYSLD